MPSEVIMYQSMFLLGVLMFGFFSVSFGNYTESADEILLESNLQEITKDVGLLIIDLIRTGQQMKSKSASFIITLQLTLASSIANKNYQIHFGIITVNGVDIGTLNTTATDVKNPISTFNLGFENNTKFIFNGNTVLYSNSGSPQVTYIWNGTTETVSFI